LRFDFGRARTSNKIRRKIMIIIIIHSRRNKIK
jgi:hypothetical protein